MKWLKNNSYIIVFAVFTCIVIGTLAITNGKIEQHEKVVIAHGDTLWSLAEQYRGSMSVGQWIRYVQRTNDMYNDDIMVGQQLIIPIEKGVYIAKEKVEEGQSREVAKRNEE